jgi:DNA-binding transcriptional regulator YiaG
MHSEELKAWRLKYQYSQSQLAKVLRVSSVTISRWETGTRDIPPFLDLTLKGIKKKGPGIKPGRPYKKQKIQKRKEVKI